METPLTILQVFVRRNACQLRCKHCSARVGSPATSIVPLDRAKDIFAEVATWREIRRGEIAYLYLQWLDDELAGDQDVELHEYVATLPATPTPAFSTNGFWLSGLSDDEAQEKIKLLKRVGKTDVQLSFHGLDRTHDAFVGRKGAFNALTRTILLVRSSGLTVRSQVFVNQQNAQEVEALCDFLRDGCGIADDDISFPATNFVGRAVQHEAMRLDAVGFALLPSRAKSGLSFLSTEAQITTQAMADPGLFSNRLSGLINPLSRILIKITAQSDVFFSTTLADTTGHAVCVGNLGSTSLADICSRVLKLKTEENCSLPDIRQLVATYADPTNQRFYTAHDCYLLWINRMKKSNQVPEDTARKLADPQH